MPTITKAQLLRQIEPEDLAVNWLIGPILSVEATSLTRGTNRTICPGGPVRPILGAVTLGIPIEFRINYLQGHRQDYATLVRAPGWYWYLWVNNTPHIVKHLEVETFRGQAIKHGIYIPHKGERDFPLSWSRKPHWQHTTKRVPGMKQVCLIGGSFNPPTRQHGQMALNILETCPWIDEIWYVPSNVHPFRHLPGKVHRPPFLTRCDWVEAMLDDLGREQGGRHLKVCYIEGTFRDPCYTMHVCQRLFEAYPSIKFHWVMGSDCVQDFSKWDGADWLREWMSFVIYPRTGYSIDERHLPPRSHVLDPSKVSTSGLSSTQVRESRDLSALTPSVAEIWHKYISAI